MVAARRASVSPETYLARERAAAEKNVLWDGEVYAMAGASPAHNAIVANVLAELRAMTRRGLCQSFASDLKVYVPLRQGFVYPDATVVCEALAFYGESRDVITNPTVLVEVLSEGTEAYDRGEKFRRYQRLASLRDYVLVSQHDRIVEVYSRRDDGRWEYVAAGEGASFHLAALGGDIAVDRVYEGVPLLPRGAAR